MKAPEPSLSIAQPHPEGVDALRKTGFAVAIAAVVYLLLAWARLVPVNAPALLITLSGIVAGTAVYAWRLYRNVPPGIKNNGVFTSSLTNKGLWAWAAGIVLTGFYVGLYWFPEILGLGQNGNNTGIIALFDPLKRFFTGSNSDSQWFVYGTLYTVAILSMGIKFMIKYRHNRYQLVRTTVVMISQLFLAYLIPEILEGLTTGQAYFGKDIKNIWPLNYYFFYDWNLNGMAEGGALGRIFLIAGIAMFLIVTPVITYFAGKRWYCSWICGCGGLAETAGDPFRQHSSKKVSAWKIERWMIHAVLVLVFLMTGATLYGYFTNSSEFLGLNIYKYFQRPYGFLIGAAFSGVIGVGFYPVLGTRIWCRFGCPLAGYMGLIQRFKSRFRITTNGGQCISCGNCSTYCEMGIDVRAYAQKGQNIVRASCVGCGICATVCPRGVLRLENGPEEGRINDNPISIGNDGIKLNGLS
ncbi:MAG: 4Fe-4S binding protein [Bacteroidia bacterium]